MLEDDFDEKEYEKFLDWCDRKIAEKEAERRQRGGPVTAGTGADSQPNVPTTPATLTSDERYTEAF